MLVAGGSKNVTLYFAMRQSSGASAGQAAIGLTITDFDLQYVRSGAAPSTKADATALAAVDSAHADNKGFEVDATNQPGLYRFDFPDAAFVAGVRETICTVKVATAFTEHLRVEIDGEVSLSSKTYAEVSSVPAAISSIPDRIGWLFALSKNKGTQTSTTKTLRNDADDGDIASSAISSALGTFTRGKWS